MVTPLTIEAQAEKQEVSDHIIQEAVKDFIPGYYNEGRSFDEFATAVANCYLSTDESSPEIEKCILGDLDLIILVAMSREQNNKLGLNDLAKDITFVSDKSWEKRFNHYLYLPKFKNMSDDDFRHYFKKGIDTINITINNTCSK